MIANIEDKITRKLFHILIGSLFIALFLLLKELTIVIALLCLIIAIFGSLKVKNGKDFLGARFFLKIMQRDNENTLPGKALIILLFSVSLVLLINHIIIKDEIALIGALLLLTFADSLCSLIGDTVGKHKLLNKKTYEGTISFFLISFLSLSLLSIPYGKSFIIAFICSLIEILPIEDNISVPLAALFLIKFL